MRVSIEPLGPEHRKSLAAHLAPYGLPPSVVDWKYYDERFRSGGPRGFVWMRHGDVRGVIGVIPFGAGPGTRAAWTCDWLVAAPSSNPGIGIALLRRAMNEIDPLFSLGGNEANRRLMPRLAVRTVADAAEEWHVPLRLGGEWWFDGVRRRFEGLSERLQRLPRVPRGMGRRAGHPGRVRVCAGIATELEPLLDSQSARVPEAVYGLEHLKWQFERCPVLEAVTVFVPSVRITSAAVCWRHLPAGLSWRLALWTSDDDDGQQRDVIAGSIAHADRCRAIRVSAVVGGSDVARQRAMQDAGFLRFGDRRALYALSARSGAHIEVPTRLGFLDSDLAYRFS